MGEKPDVVIWISSDEDEPTPSTSNIKKGQNKTSKMSTRTEHIIVTHDAVSFFYLPIPVPPNDSLFSFFDQGPSNIAKGGPGSKQPVTDAGELTRLKAAVKKVSLGFQCQDSSVFLHSGISDERSLVGCQHMHYLQLLDE